MKTPKLTLDIGGKVPYVVTCVTEQNIRRIFFGVMLAANEAEAMALGEDAARQQYPDSGQMRIELHPYPLWVYEEVQA